MTVLLLYLAGIFPDFLLYSFFLENRMAGVEYLLISCLITEVSNVRFR